MVIERRESEVRVKERRRSFTMQSEDKIDFLVVKSF